MLARLVLTLRGGNKSRGGGNSHDMEEDCNAVMVCSPRHVNRSAAHDLRFVVWTHGLVSQILALSTLGQLL